MSVEVPTVKIEDKYTGLSFQVVDEGPIVRISCGENSVDVPWCPRVRSILDAIAAADKSLEGIDE